MGSLTIRARTLIIPALCVLALTGCGQLTDLLGLSGRIGQAGYEHVQATHKEINGHDVLTITADTPADRVTDNDVTEIARIVWETYPRHIDELRIDLNGSSALNVDSAELEEAFGPRDPVLDKDVNLAGVFIGVLVAVLLLAVGLVILVIVLIRRGRRRRPVQDQPFPPYHHPGS